MSAALPAPGSWLVDIKDGDGYVMGGDELEIYTVDESGCVLDSIAMVPLDTGEDTEEDRASVRASEANARYIAAVPDLLEALKVSQANLSSLVASGWGGRESTFGPWLDVVRAALKKAGVTP